ncbi:MAG: hypothetical protein ABIK08_15135 [Pseudomonadota bacterium]
MSHLERTERTIDASTGEILSEKKNIIQLRKVEDEPDFIKLYISDLAYFYKLEPLAVKVLTAVAAHMGYDGLVSLTPSRRAEIIMSLGCSRSGFDNCLTALCRDNLLKRVGRGEYRPNPLLFGRGQWKEIRERRQSFAVKITYSAEPDKPARSIDMGG